MAFLLDSSWLPAPKTNTPFLTYPSNYPFQSSLTHQTNRNSEIKGKICIPFAPFIFSRFFSRAIFAFCALPPPIASLSLCAARRIQVIGKPNCVWEKGRVILALGKRGEERLKEIALQCGTRELSHKSTCWRNTSLILTPIFSFILILYNYNLLIYYIL